MESHETPRDGQSAHDGPQAVSDLFGPRLRDEFEQLHKAERKVLRALAKPGVADRYAADPLAVLAELKIQVPPIIRQRLKSAGSGAGFAELTRPRSFRLPDGQVVTARVNLRFTGTPNRSGEKS